MKITVFGSGYVGLVQAAVLAEFFPDQPPARISADVAALFSGLGHAPAPPAPDEAPRAMTEAEADLSKARIQLRKAEILSEIDKRKNETLAESAAGTTRVGFSVAPA